MGPDLGHIILRNPQYPLFGVRLRRRIDYGRVVLYSQMESFPDEDYFVQQVQLSRLIPQHILVKILYEIYSIR